jgi:hypothetical protein
LRWLSLPVCATNRVPGIDALDDAQVFPGFSIIDADLVIGINSKLNKKPGERDPTCRIRQRGCAA